MTRATVDGNEAAVSVAYRLNEVCCIYPITPSSPMAELADEWSSAQRPSVWGTVPTVVEMQSEGGAAGALHGALQSGALTTTFTSSQGLLLMIPNMYKIAGELTSAVINVAARSLAAQGLSIFGDHSDVMAVRQTGFALLASASVQEAHDLALVAQAATLATRVPFVHFFDGFRTSHELNTIETLSDDDLRALVPEELVWAHRGRALSPERPFIRGTAQNPDVYFQARETVNPFYARVPGVVGDLMTRLGERTGRTMHIVDYTGHPEAERVLVVMGSGAQTVAETVAALGERGERVGVVQVRLYRPFPTSALLEALPATVRTVGVLDRTKEPGSLGEPLYLDVVAALAEAHADGERLVMPRVTGGRYGLSSKEFTPAMVAGVFAELAREQPRRRFTIGIDDDVSETSVDYDPSFDIESPDTVRAVFFGLGSDGTVGANKNTIKILGSEEGLHAQAYFVYDSKKSGSQTESHLRRAGSHRAPIWHRQSLAAIGWFDKVDVPSAPRATLLNCRHPADKSGTLPRRVQQIQVSGSLFTVDADRIARGRVGRAHQHRAADLLLRDLDVLPREQAITRIENRWKTYETAAPRCWQGTGAVDGAWTVVPIEVPTLSPPRAHTDVPSRCRTSFAPDRGDMAGRDGTGHLVDGPARRHDGLRETQHLRPGRSVGFRQLHPVRQLRLRLPAQRDPVQVLRPVPTGRGTEGVRLRAAGCRRPAQRPVLAAGVCGGLHRVRPVRRGLPGRHTRPDRDQGDQPRSRRAAGGRRAGEHRLLRVSADQ
jgi:pyruvate-ferredoxin/flavodoxin oxidoreductase